MSLQSFLQTICTRCVYISGSQQLFQRTQIFLNIHYVVIQKLKLSLSLYFKFYKLQKFENFAAILLVGNQKIMEGQEPLLYTLKIYASRWPSRVEPQCSLQAGLGSLNVSIKNTCLHFGLTTICLYSILDLFFGPVLKEVGPHRDQCFHCIVPFNQFFTSYDTSCDSCYENPQS